MKFLQTSMLALTVGLFACNSEPKTTETVIKDNEVKEPVTDVKAPATPAARCYAKRSAGDTFWLQINTAESVVTGNLRYIFKEKDSNRGEISGKMNGDTLLADYTFMSEGQTSVRQVAFLIKDGQATEGYGDLVDNNGKMVFKNPSALTFGKGIVMKETACVQ